MVNPAAGGGSGDDDARLMTAFRDGDRSALEEIFRRYAAPLVSFAFRILRDRGRAEEAAQEVFIKVLRAAPRYEPTGKFSTWIFTIATRHCLNELRDRRETAAPPEVLGERAAPEGDSPHAETERREIGGRLEEALGELPETQRAALLLTAREGLSYREAAEALGTTEKALKSLIHRARTSLRERLEGGRNR